MSLITRLVNKYWHQPDHYTWMVGYLRARGLDVRVRLLIVGAMASYSLLPVTMLWSASGPRGFASRVVVVVVAMSVFTTSVWRVPRWPPQWGSIAGVVLADVGTVFVCTSYSDPVVGLIGCMTFALLGGYIAFFHSIRLQVLNLGLGLVAAILLAVDAAGMTRDIVVTLNMATTVIVAIVALSVTAHVLVQFLGADLDNSDTDPLCGLMNRRAFYRGIHQLHTAAGQSTGGSCLTVMMIDLDDFKHLNDSRGHAVGDAALVTVGGLLTDMTADSAVVARVGGEEFLIADLADPAEAARQALDLCDAIAGSEFGITASIGLVYLETSEPPLRAQQVLIDRLIDIADMAMYDAKRAGGNQIRTVPHSHRI